MDNLSKPPQPPNSRVITDGVTNFCNICGSSLSKNGFLGIFGEYICHNEKCENSKPRIKKK